MRILLSNDDGINAKGLRAIYTALIAAGHEVSVYAPATEQSATSSRLTLHDPLRLHTVQDGDFHGTAVSGTPVDCVLMGLSRMSTPDMVVSGINAGPNMGLDVIYSGTVAAALEGAIRGIPSLALSIAPASQNLPNHLADAAAHAAGLVTSLPWATLLGRVINVNYPACSLAEALTRGVQVCPLTVSAWQGSFDHRTDPRGRDYWWFNVGDARFRHAAHEAGTDTVLLETGHITLTPLHHDLTDRPLAASLSIGLAAAEAAQQARAKDIVS